MSRYPEIRAGQRITGEMLTSMQFEEIVKQSGTSRTSTTTPVADPELQFQLEANAVYYVEFFIRYASAATGRFKTEWGTPGGWTGLKECRGLGDDVNGGDNAQGDMRTGVHGFATDVSYGYRNAGNQASVLETGTIITDGTAGTLSFNWCQDASSASPTEVASYSYARLKRIS